MLKFLKRQMDRKIIYASLILATGIVIASALFYLNAERERDLRNKEIEALLLLQQQDYNRKNAEEVVKNAQLDQCLNDVDSRFSKIASDTPNLTLDAWKLVLDEKQRQKDDCYRRYQ